MILKKGSVFYHRQVSFVGTHWYKTHVVQEIHDDGYDMFVIKWYGKAKQWWHYQVVQDFEVQLDFEYGKYAETKPKKEKSHG